MKKLIIIALILLLAAPVWAGPMIEYVTPDASATQAGKVELATDTETVTGTATDRAVTPANLRAVISDDSADATLSGTPVIFTIKDKDGNAYYIKAYPTKTP